MHVNRVWLRRFLQLPLHWLGSRSSSNSYGDAYNLLPQIPLEQTLGVEAIITLSPNYTLTLMLFYLVVGAIFSLLLAIKTSSTLTGMILSLSIILVGSEYYEAPIFFLRYLQLFGYKFPLPLSIINHALMAAIFLILCKVSGIKRTWNNAAFLIGGVFLSALCLFGLHNIWLARTTGLSVLFLVTLDAISMKGFSQTRFLDVKDYYRKGENYDWVSDPKWLEKVFHRRREKETVETIRRYSANSSVLDVGCGTGLITRDLEGNVFGLDINLWNLERARINAPNARFMLGDCENMNAVPSDFFDLVVFTETLEHVPNPEKALAEVRRVLKVDGKAVITVPTQSLIWRFRRYLTTTHPHNEPFHRTFSKKILLETLNGFKLLEVRKVAYGLTWLVVVQKP